MKINILANLIEKTFGIIKKTVVYLHYQNIQR